MPPSRMRSDQTHAERLGLRMALGANMGTVFRQMMMHALVLTGAGPRARHRSVSPVRARAMCTRAARCRGAGSADLRRRRRRVPAGRPGGRQYPRAARAARIDPGARSATELTGLRDIRSRRPAAPESGPGRRGDFHAYRANRRQDRLLAGAVALSQDTRRCRAAGRAPPATTAPPHRKARWS